MGRCTGPRYDGHPLCKNHCRQLAASMMYVPEVRDAMLDTAASAEVTVRAEQREHQKAIADAEFVAQATFNNQVRRPDCPIVYYVRLGFDHIKIGTSIYLPQRMRDLRVIDTSHVLAAEPGGREVERRRHLQFAHLKYEILLEDFRQAPDLMEHIAAVRAEHGDPFELHRRLMGEARERLLAERDGV